MIELNQRVRILTTCAREINRGTVVGSSDKCWVVRPDGRGRQRFSKATGCIVTGGRAVRPQWPRIAP